MWIDGHCHQSSIDLHYFHLAKVVAEVVRRFPFGKTKFKSCLDIMQIQKSLTSALDDGGDGSGPNMCCESNISFELSDL